jgi:hypothetical protein
MPSYSEDSCRDIFLKDLASKETTVQDKNAALASKYARCAQNSSSNASSSGSGTNAGVNAEGYGSANVGQSHNSGSSSSSSASDCGSQSAEENTSAALFYSHITYPDIANNWKDCMTRREEFACWAEPTGSINHLVIRADWHILSAKPKVINSNLTVGRQNRSPPFAKGTRLLLGQNTINVDRGNDDDVSLTIDASPDNVVSRSCAVWVPSPQQAMKAPAVVQASWRTDTPTGTLPTDGTCSCASVLKPTPPDPPGFLPHTPYPSGSQLTVVNNCRSDLRVFVVNDRAARNGGIPPLTSAKERYFAYQALASEQRLNSDISDAVGVGVWFEGCPPGASPGADCTCQVGPISHLGVFWQGFVPPL